MKKNSIVIWKIALIAIILLGTIQIAAVNGIEFLELLKKDVFVFGCYILILLIFRQEFNLDKPSMNLIVQVSMIVVSAYLSYLAFCQIGLPGSISIMAGIGFVFSYKKLIGLIMKLKISKGHDIGFGVTVFLFMILITVAGLDMFMSAANFVVSEGKNVTRFKALEKKKQIDELAVQKQQLDILDKLVKGGNYANARFHSDRFARVNSDSSQVSTQIMGNLQQGFTDIFGSKEQGRKATMWFIIVVSFAITALVGTNEVEKYLFLQSDELYEPVINNSSTAVQAGITGVGFQLATEEEVNERSEKKRVPVGTKLKLIGKRLFEPNTFINGKKIGSDKIEKLKRNFEISGSSDETILYLWNNGYVQNKSQAGRVAGQILKRPKPVSASYATRVINNKGNRK